MIHIIIPVHNRITLTKKCIESLDNQNYKNWKLYIVDDGSSDGTRDWILEKNRNDIVVLEGEGSLWWTGSINKAISYINNYSKKSDYIMTVNNDIIFTENTIHNLINNIDDKSICSSVSLDSINKKAMSSGSKVLSWFFNITVHPFYGKRQHEFFRKGNIELDMLTGRSVLYPATIFLDGNNFDNINFPHYGGDSEFTSRAKRKGYKLLLVPTSKVYVSRESTGLNPLDKKLSFNDSLKSLFSIKSTNNLKTKIKFSMRVPPLYARPTYLLISIIKVFLLIFIGNFFVNKNDDKIS